MGGEEVSSKLVRFLSFVGAGVICTAAINFWRDLDRKSTKKNSEILENENKILNGESVHS